VALEVDPALHDPIRYTAAMLREPPDPRGADRFLQLLEGNLARVVLRRHGFQAEGVAP
jgi:ABC-type molybdate transport system substrate-binding protein